MDKLVFCMRWGTRYGPEYVNRLYSACTRHITGPFQFVCFTDDARDLQSGIDARPLPPFEAPNAVIAALPWRKMSIWQRGLGDDLVGRDALFLDLDVVIVGSLDPLFSYQSGKYVVIENWTQPGSGIGNTSVFRYPVGKHSSIYDAYLKVQAADQLRKFRIEQRFISEHMPAGEQVFWPRAWVRSFKEELIPAWPLRIWKPVPLPSDARIVVFHGKPDPDEARVGQWPAKSWKRIYKIIRPVEWIDSNWR